MSGRPNLLFADEDGNIFDRPEFEMVGSSAGRWRRLEPGDWIPLPEGSELFVLPKRAPVGYNRNGRRFEVLSEASRLSGKGGLPRAVAAFIAPAHTQIFSAAYKSLPGAPLLPLFAYTAAGWHKGRFVVAGTRVDPDDRQDIGGFDPARIERNATRRMADERGNRLVQHLGGCALTYGCPAARNLFLNRFEAPLPVSPACNARCLGCISLQDREDLCATQPRIAFVPTPEEIAGIAVPHLRRAARAVASFGQGCEGEPLLQADTIETAIRLVRGATSRGTINLNTNGSLPDRVKRLCDAGLDSIRVSMNSCRPQYYNAYYRPAGYVMADLKRSVLTVKASGGFASINYFVLPGVADEEAEWEALSGFISETGVDLIQLRNFNIDPEWYLRSINHAPSGKTMGVRRWMALMRERFPDLRFGYFNPCLDPGAGEETQ